MMKSIELPKQYRDAGLRASSFNDRDNTIEVIFTTGASVTRRGPSGYYEEELILEPSSVRLERLNSGAAPLLDSHADYEVGDVLGVVVEGSAKIVGGKGVAKVRLSTAPGDADAVEKIRTGVVKGVSVGYRVHRVEVIERNGLTPIWRVVDWEPLEISAVPVPADAGAMFRKRSGEAAATHPVEMIPLDYWSVPAVRARMITAQRAAGIHARHHEAPEPRRPEPIVHGLNSVKWIDFDY